MVITIIGLLIALLLPAIQAAREAARQMQCTNNLKQIGLALHNFHDARGGIPPCNLTGSGHATWLVLIMPYLEQQGLSDRYDIEKTAFVEPNLSLITTQIAGYYCPTRRGPPQLANNGPYSANGALCDYAINVGDFGDANPRWFIPEYAFGVTYPSNTGPGVGVTTGTGINKVYRQWRLVRSFADIVDGLSNTLMVGEKHVHPEHLGDQQYGDGTLYYADYFPPLCRLAGRNAISPAYSFPLAASPTDPISPPPDTSYGYHGVFGSWHSGGACGFVMADGSVHCVMPSIDIDVLGHLANIKDGFPIPANAF